jgi:O-antigen ligase
MKKLAPFVVAAASLMAVGMLALAGTRSVVGGLVVAVVAVLLVLRSSLGRARLLISIGVLVVVASLLGVGATVLRPDLVSGFFGTFERGPIFMVALDIAALAPWVGSGDGAWLGWVGVVEPSLPIAVAPHTHSAYLTLLMEGGAFGLAAAVVMFALLLRWAAVRARVSTGVGSVAFLACVMTLLVQSVVDVTLLHPAVYLPLALAGVLNAVGGGSYAQRSERVLDPQNSHGNAHG